MIVPMLLMFATFDYTMYGIIQTMLGIKINCNNIFWAESNEFKKDILPSKRNTPSRYSNTPVMKCLSTLHTMVATK